MLRRLIVVTALAAGMSIAVITLATPALAKGPSQARITGPGLARAIVVSGAGEPGQQGMLAVLAGQTGLFTVLFGADASVTSQPPTPLRPQPPKASLGPRYTITYTVPGEYPLPGKQFGQIRQDLYPRAAGGPVIFTPPRQPGGPLPASDGSGRVATCPAPLPSSGCHRDRAHKPPPRPVSALPDTRRQRSKRAHAPLPGSSHQPQPLRPWRSPAPCCGCVIASPPPCTAPN